MRSYIIVNAKDFDDFFAEVKNMQSTGLSFTFNFIERTTDKPDSGGWGCARFHAEAPPTKIFNEDDTEYRWSAEENAWTVNGVVYDDQPFIEGLYNYFVSQEGVTA